MAHTQQFYKRYFIFKDGIKLKNNILPEFNEIYCKIVVLNTSLNSKSDCYLATLTYDNFFTYVYSIFKKKKKTSELLKV